MEVLKVICIGLFNSYRQPDFHTYHKSLPLPPKTTITGMLGGAFGLSPEEVNEKWLIDKSIKIGIVGKSKGNTKDLWRIRKYKAGKSLNFISTPLIREIHFDNHYTIYFKCLNSEQYEEIENALLNPKWALSFGREDELIKIKSIEKIDVEEKSAIKLRNTIVNFDVNEVGYVVDDNYNLLSTKGNLLNLRPVIIRLPISFKYKEDHSRVPFEYSTFSFIGELSIIPKSEQILFYDMEANQSFQLI